MYFNRNYIKVFPNKNASFRFDYNDTKVNGEWYNLYASK